MIFRHVEMITHNFFLFFEIPFSIKREAFLKFLVNDIIINS